MKSFKILAVDDELDILEIYKSMVDSSYTLVTASNAQEAIFKIKNDRFDLIITDYKMPKKDGLEFLRELRTQEEVRGQKSVPVLVISGFLDDIQSTLIQEANCDYLPKPFSAKELNNKLSSLLNMPVSSTPEQKIFKIKVDEGVTIIKKGAFSKKIFWVVSGKLGVMDKNDQMIAELGFDQIAGELSALDDTPSQNNVVTLEKCELVCIDINLFKDHFKKQPQWFKLLVLDLSRKLKETSSKVFEE